jgi:hypothetical protein
MKAKEARERTRMETREAKERVKREAEEARKAKKAEALAKKEAEREAKERAKRETEEARKANKAEALAKKEAEREAKERAKREAEEARKAKKAEREAEEVKGKAKGEAEEPVSAELYKGIVKLTIMPPIDIGQVRKLEEYLYQVQDLRLVLVGGSIDEGTEIVVSAENPIPLIDALRELPPVDQIVKKGKTIQLTLKAE